MLFSTIWFEYLKQSTMEPCSFCARNLAIERHIQKLKKLKYTEADRGHFTIRTWTGLDT